MTESVQIITRVPRELRQAFKTICAARGETMTAVLIAAINREVAKQPRLKK